MGDVCSVQRKVGILRVDRDRSRKGRPSIDLRSRIDKAKPRGGSPEILNHAVHRSGTRRFSPDVRIRSSLHHRKKRKRDPVSSAITLTTSIRSTCRLDLWERLERMPCVYTLPAGLCDGSAPLSKREHYLPRGLGNFKHDPRLVDKICNKCQGKFSQAED